MTSRIPTCVYRVQNCKVGHSVKYILCPYTIYEHSGSIWGVIYIDNLRLLEPILDTKPERLKRQTYLHSYVRFCGNIMCTAGPNDNLWLTKVTGMDINYCEMPNGSNYALFGAVGGVLGLNWGKTKNWRYVVVW